MSNPNPTANPAYPYETLACPHCGAMVKVHIGNGDQARCLCLECHGTFSAGEARRKTTSTPSDDLCHHGTPALFCQICDREALESAGIISPETDPTPTEPVVTRIDKGNEPLTRVPMRSGPFVRWADAGSWHVYADAAPESQPIGAVYRDDSLDAQPTTFSGYLGPKGKSQCVCEHASLPEAARSVFAAREMTLD